jgi:hypothetical protein
MEERRQFPRHDTTGQLATVPASVNVRVLDISVAGVLLHSSEAVTAGTKGNLRLMCRCSGLRQNRPAGRVTGLARPSWVSAPTCDN